MGVLDSVPESWKSRRTGEAITAPSAILMAGAGAAAGILAGLAALPVVGIAAACGDATETSVTSIVRQIFPPSLMVCFAGNHRRRECFR